MSTSSASGWSLANARTSPTRCGGGHGRGDGAGFDVLSFDLGGKERLIEVKTTNGAARTPFFMTRNEMAVADESRALAPLSRAPVRPAAEDHTVRPPLDMLNLNPGDLEASPLSAGAAAL